MNFKNDLIFKINSSLVFANKTINHLNVLKIAFYEFEK
jgi:hypothetical protein